MAGTRVLVGTRKGAFVLTSDEARTDCADVTVPAGHLYVLGDHRVVSQDSRQEGPVRREAVEARVLTRVWPVGRA